TILSGLRSRVFLMNNVHEDEPVVFQTRWTLSYLRGPLTREQIGTLMSPRKRTHDAAEVSSSTAPDAKASSSAAAPPETEPLPPVLPASITQLYAAVDRSLAGGERLIYRPAIVGLGRVHF